MKNSEEANNKIPEAKQLAKSLIDLAETGIYIVAQGKFVYISHIFEKLSGYKSVELVGKQSLTTVHPDDRQQVREAAIAMLKGLRQSPYEYRFINKDGSIAWVLGKVISIDYGQGRAALGSFWDITEYKLVEEQIAQQRLFLRQVIDANPSLIFVKDTNERYVLVNEVLAKAYGLNPDAMEGKTDIELGVNPGEYAKHRVDDLQVMRSGNKKIIPEESFTWPSGEIHYYQTVKIPLVTAKGECGGILGVSTDITERQALERKLSEAATHDPLTGLPNRTLLKDRFEVAAASADREQRKIAIAMIDLDGFKAVNDTYGHEIGDKLLVKVAGKLQGSLRKSDTVARVGGDEFALSLTAVRNDNQVIVIADKIKRDFQRPVMISGHRIKSTMSMGIGLYPDDGKDLDVLLKKADRLMYEAKESGKNNYRFHLHKKTIRSRK